MYKAHLSHVVDLAVDRDPAVTLGRVLGDLHAATCERWGIGASVGQPSAQCVSVWVRHRAHCIGLQCCHANEGGESVCVCAC
jgi:hypothetical protein